MTPAMFHLLIVAMIVVGAAAGFSIAAFLQARKDAADRIERAKKNAATPSRRTDDHRPEPRRISRLGDLDAPKQPKGPR